MSNDLFASLKTYLTKLSDGEKTPAEVAAAVNAWAREGAESLKARIHEEVEAAALRLGFVKREEFDQLVARVNAIAPQQSKGSATKTASTKKSSAKKAAVEKSTAKKSPVEKSTAKKSPAKKSGSSK